MEFALVLRYLLSRRRLLALGAVIAAVAAVLSIYRPDGFGLKARSIVYSAASTQVLIDTPSSVLGNVTNNTAALQNIATVDANFMASPAVLALIGNQVGLQGDQLYAAGPVDPNVPRTVQEPTALQRNVQLTGENTPYRLGFTADPNLPEVGIYSQAPTTKLAVALANASVVALTDYVTKLEATENVPSADRVVIRPLGSAVGAVVDPGIAKSLAALVFVAVFVLWCGLMLAGSKLVGTWKASGHISRAPRVAGLRYEVLLAPDGALLAPGQAEGADAGLPAAGESAGEKDKNDGSTTEKPANEKPVNGKPVNDEQVDDKTVGEKPANDKAANDKPASDKQANGKPANGKPANGKPVNGKPVSDKQVEDKTVGDKTVGDKAANDKPVSDKPANPYMPIIDDATADDTTANEAAAHEKPANEKRRRRAPVAQAVREVEEHLAHRQKV
jgi:hypothetical protein